MPLLRLSAPIVGILIACILSLFHADVPNPAEEDTLAGETVFKGKITQRGTHPDWGEIPSELEAVLTVTKRNGPEVEVELNESTATLKITFV